MSVGAAANISHTAAMPRKRVVSPELLISESVARLPIATRYFFVGLWMYLDDEGRGRDNAALICAHQWPLDRDYTPERVEADLVLLAAELICRYRVDGQPYLHSPTWKAWQKISHPTPSRVPPCPIELAGDIEHRSLPGFYRSPHGVLMEEYGSPPGILLPNVIQFNVKEVKGSTAGEDEARAAAREAVAALGKQGRAAAQKRESA